MATGSSTSSPSSLIKKEFHAGADNPDESQREDLSSFIDISRNRIRILKTDPGLKAVELTVFAFPRCSDDARWSGQIAAFIGSGQFAEVTAQTEVNYSVCDARISIIPRTIYSVEMKEQLFGFTHGTRPDASILTQNLIDLDAIGLFAVPRKLETVLNGPVTSSFLAWVQQNMKNANGMVAHLYIDEGEFALAVGKERKLLFCNWFKVSSAEDVLYFLMATLEGLKVLHTDVPVILSGEIGKHDTAHMLICRYMPKVTFAKRPKTLNYAYSFNEVAAHRHPFVFRAACA